MKEYLLSVIVPVYNARHTIRRCIESIQKQKYENLEIILVDDGSTDDSYLICQNYAELDNRIHIVQKENGGAASARNTGLQVAQGDILAFVDSDDYIDESMYSSMIDFLVKEELDIVVCGRIDEYPDNSKIINFQIQNKVIFSSINAICNILTWKNMDFSPCDKIFKRELFDAVFFPDGKRSEDIITIAELVLKAKNIGHIGEAYYHYCHRDNSCSTCFSVKLGLDTLYSTNEVELLLRKRIDFSEISASFQYYVAHQYLLTWRIFQACNYNGPEVKIVRGYFSHDDTIVKSNFSIKLRIIYILLKYNLYGFIWRYRHKRVT